MATQATLLLLVSAIFHAGWNAMAKRQQQPQINLMGILIIATLLGWLCTPWVVTRPALTLKATLWACAAGLFEGAYMFTLARAYLLSSLGVAYTIMRGGAMLLVWVSSQQLLQETVTPMVALAIAMVLLGIGLTQIHRWSALISDFQRCRFAYLAAVCIAGYHLCYRNALTASAHPLLVYNVAMLTAAILVLVFSSRAKFQQCWQSAKQNPWYFLSAGTLTAFSFLFFLYALRFVGAGYAITLRNTSIVFALMFTLVLGEKSRWQQWLGATLVMVGIALLYRQT